MPRLLELFCGTKSIGRAFEAAGWNLSPRSCATSGAGTTRCFRRGTLTWSGSPVCAECSRAPSTTRGGRRAGAQSPRDHGAFRPAHVGHRESGHRAAEDPPVHETHFRAAPRHGRGEPERRRPLQRGRQVQGPREGPERALGSGALQGHRGDGQLGKLGDKTFPARILEYVGLRSKTASSRSSPTAAQGEAQDQGRAEGGDQRPASRVSGGVEEGSESSKECLPILP